MVLLHSFYVMFYFSYIQRKLAYMDEQPQRYLPVQVVSEVDVEQERTVFTRLQCPFIQRKSTERHISLFVI